MNARDLIIIGDALKVLKSFPDDVIDCVMTSPPYWGLRDYQTKGQLGLEETLDKYIEKLTDVFREVRRVLKDEGTLWLNIGDSYYNYRPGGVSQVKQTFAKHDGAVVEYSSKRNTRILGLKEKDLIGQPWRLAFSLQTDGWYLRSDIIWHKPNPMPESVLDRPTKAHEYLFLFSKKVRYYYDAEAIKEPAKDWGKRDRKPGSAFVDGTPGRAKQSGGKDCDFSKRGRNKRTVWTIPTQSCPEAHFAVFPERLVEPCIKAGCPVGGIVLDPFMGSGTVALVAKKLGRDYLGIELSMEYLKIIRSRLYKQLGIKARAIDRR